MQQPDLFWWKRRMTIWHISSNNCTGCTVPTSRLQNPSHRLQDITRWYGPVYLNESLVPYSCDWEGLLSSNDITLLREQKTKSITFGDRVLSIYEPNNVQQSASWYPYMQHTRIEGFPYKCKHWAEVDCVSLCLIVSICGWLINLTPSTINIDEYIKIENENMIFWWIRVFLLILYYVLYIIFNVLSIHCSILCIFSIIIMYQNVLQGPNIYLQYDHKGKITRNHKQI